MDKDQLRIDFTKRLQKIMVVRKIDPKDLIDGVRAHKSQVSRWVTGRVIPSRTTIKKLAEFFKCNVEWLATGKGEMVLNRLTSNSPEVTNKPGGDTRKPKSDEAKLQSYKKAAQLDSEFLFEVQNWLKGQETIQPGFGSWFRLEFQNRFPEFTIWRKISKKTVT